MKLNEYQLMLESGEELSERQLEDLIWNVVEIHEKVHDRGRWQEYVSTVFKFDDSEQLWCIDWDRGLTEGCDHMFYKQPYKVSLKQEEVVVTKTTINAE